MEVLMRRVSKSTMGLSRKKRLNLLNEFKQFTPDVDIVLGLGCTCLAGLRLWSELLVNAMWWLHRIILILDTAKWSLSFNFILYFTFSIRRSISKNQWKIFIASRQPAIVL